MWVCRRRARGHRPTRRVHGPTAWIVCCPLLRLPLPRLRTAPTPLRILSCDQNLDPLAAAPTAQEANPAVMPIVAASRRCADTGRVRLFNNALMPLATAAVYRR